MSDSIIFPNVGHDVLCYLHNSTILEGIVKEWNENYIHLISKNNESIIIYYPMDNVLFVKIKHKEKPNKEYNEIKKEYNEIKKEYNETIKQPTSDLRNKKIADLKILLNEQEKEILANKLKEQIIKEPMLPQGISQFNLLKKIKG
jgi:hypothetical protein